MGKRRGVGRAMAERGGRFKASPLSIAVPEGAFEKWMEEEVTFTRSERRNARGGGGEPETSKSYTRRWPKLSKLTFNDLISEGKEWVEFFGLKSGLQNSYGLPAMEVSEVIRKADENLSRYLVNYLRATLVMMCCLLCERPESLVGIIVILAIVDWFTKFTAHTNLDKQSTTYQILSILVTLFIWYVVFLSKAVVSISRSLLVAGVVVFLHACLRLTEDEERQKVKVYKKQKKNR